MTSNKNFQETGNKIPISFNELMDYAHMKFSEYNKTKTGPNPFTNPIIYTTKDGKTIMIPTDIQNQAIQLWKKSGGVEPFQQEAVDIKKDNHEFLKFTLLTLIIIITLYLFFNADNDQAMFNTKHIKFYLTRT